ncbi:MAG TPA: hypothetical protein RMF84_06275 [Polyangiaceae bacterium LLY-WYZ-14_1]|nr:hypothetical protein [Polyangiaceae bacterium LLY-WYZ-14_1]
MKKRALRPDESPLCGRALVACFVSLAAACGNDRGAGTNEPYPLLDCDPIVPELCGFPFPSNVYTVRDQTTATGRRVAFGPGVLQGNDDGPWARSDGFSAGTPILAFIPGATGEALPSAARIETSVLDGSPTLILDVATGEPVLHFAELDVRAPNAEQRALVIRPATRLRDDSRYIVAVRNLRDEVGRVIEPSSAFRALREASEATDASVESRRALYEDIFARLADVGWAREDVQIAWDFNTASDDSNTRDLLHMRDEGLALVGDTPEYTITDVDADFRPEDFAFRILGRFRVPLYLTQPTPGGVLLRDESGLPTVNPEQPWAEYPFEVLIPRSAVDAPAPLLQYGHGVFDDHTQVEFSALRQFVSENGYVIFGVDLLGMAAGDLDAVASALLVGDIAGLQPMWDRLLQGHLNSQVAMRMMIESFSKDPVYGQYVDATRRYYHGISQGGISGAVYMALSNDVERAALSVGGQPYSTILFRSDRFDAFLDLLEIQYPDARVRQLLVALAQMPWDRAEPNGFSHHVLAQRFESTIAKQIMSMGAAGDHALPNVATDIMSRTLGLTHLTTGLRDIVGLEATTSTTDESFYIEFGFGLPPVPDCGVAMTLCEDPHGELPSVSEAQSVMDAFFRTGEGVNPCSDGVCAFPEIGACTPEEDAEAADALCAR